jgi:16S rRNA (cytidine1402-2'-O)-methyltransferase
MAASSEPAAGGLGTLFLVPTPIGNFSDITSRATDVLRTAAVVAAEDTRKARTLLRALGISARLISYHDFNEESRSAELLRLLQAGQDVALISDAGTPLLNDPGYRIVCAAIAHGARVSPLPGPSAVVTALVGSGLPAHRFLYAGFLPRKSAARQSAVRQLADLPATLIFFEAPHRLQATVSDLREVLGDREAALARNLTKKDEEYIRGSLSAIGAELASRAEIRGEYTVLVAAAPEPDLQEADQLADRIARSLLERGIEPHVAREVVKDVTGLPRNRVYECVQGAQRSRPATGDLSRL